MHRTTYAAWLDLEEIAKLLNEHEKLEIKLRDNIRLDGEYFSLILVYGQHVLSRRVFFLGPDGKHEVKQTKVNINNAKNWLIDLVNEYNSRPKVKALGFDD